MSVYGSHCLTGSCKFQALDPTLLSKFGIKTQVDIPGVGQNLQDHLQIRTIYEVKNTTTLNEKTGLWGKGNDGLNTFKTGPLTMPPSQLDAFAKSDGSQRSANEWHVQPLSLDKFGEPLHQFNAITPSVCNVEPVVEAKS